MGSAKQEPPTNTAAFQFRWFHHCAVHHTADEVGLCGNRLMWPGAAHFFSGGRGHQGETATPERRSIPYTQRLDVQAALMEAGMTAALSTSQAGGGGGGGRLDDSSGGSGGGQSSGGSGEVRHAMSLRPYLFTLCRNSFDEFKAFRREFPKAWWSNVDSVDSTWGAAHTGTGVSGVMCD